MSGSIDERMESDHRALAEVISTMGVTNDTSSFRISRIGKTTSTRSRLLKVDCRNVCVKNEILRNAKKLRKSTHFKNIYINEDRTPQQQQEWRRIRQDLKQRREAGEDVVIYRNKVILREELQGFQKPF